MDNREASELLADLYCERTGRTACAAQIFIASAVLPPGTKTYTLKNMETYIFEYLEANRRKEDE